ncbi:2-amino-4-hydroxy-6-hydroxymethyldihydropteridine diphosphokinase [Dysgonomonas alginatilytica]|uniref:2-amino-4-hydroxy-6-hydroxymethyldihydropteridine pyrophosphokinase n=1 Tax=Dysgonomonas alginatilytica TaxID=1605892 RepID=A0A2V3PVW4_9BACT|nr:2-amino-4-hydroxy-6-hydroxymethyldihydropteridine diphosphokinase [Dysgonomonas alginatilytica]PXV64110.1 2-amino-4-hydroxy-6-hydroxymethyldihydropteridine diphosphokinase [Dysgonomonas alginatilytica]
MNVYLYPIMNTFIISMGSNENRTENMSRCRYLLSKYYPDVMFSEMINTEPFGDNYQSDFLNQLALINSEDDDLTVTERLKKIETEIGRQPEEKSRGIIKIDVDLLVVNGNIIKTEDFERPYINNLFENFIK